MDEEVKLLRVNLDEAREKLKQFAIKEENLTRLLDEACLKRDTLIQEISTVIGDLSHSKGFEDLSRKVKIMVEELRDQLYVHINSIKNF